MLLVHFATVSFPRMRPVFPLPCSSPAPVLNIPRVSLTSLCRTAAIGYLLLNACAVDKSRGTTEHKHDGGTHLMRSRWAAAVAWTCVNAEFVSSQVGPNRDLLLAYGNKPRMQLFLRTGSALIILGAQTAPGLVIGGSISPPNTSSAICAHAG